MSCSIFRKSPFPHIFMGNMKLILQKLLTNGMIQYYLIFSMELNCFIAQSYLDKFEISHDLSNL